MRRWHFRKDAQERRILHRWQEQYHRVWRNCVTVQRAGAVRCQITLERTLDLVLPTLQRTGKSCPFWSRKKRTKAK
jgi:hypothetical protein